MSSVLQFPAPANRLDLPKGEAPPRLVMVQTLNPRASYATRRWAPPGLRRFAGPLLLLVLWQAVSALGLIDERTITSPLSVVHAAQELLATGDLQRHFSASLTRVAYGLSLGISLGIGLAVLAGFFRLGEDLIDSSLNMLRMIPVISILPLIIVGMGIGEPAKIALIVIGTIFPIYMNSFAAIRGVDEKLIEAGRAYGLSRAGLIRRVIIPGAVPGFLVGLRWALGAAWLLLFFAEQVNADSGIGYLINQAQAWNRTDIILLGMTIYALLGLTGDLAVKLLERRLLGWRRSFDGN
jgi:sulfonate transport system permease protein